MCRRAATSSGWRMNGASSEKRRAAEVDHVAKLRVVHVRERFAKCGLGPRQPPRRLRTSVESRSCAFVDRDEVGFQPKGRPKIVISPWTSPSLVSFGHLRGRTVKKRRNLSLFVRLGIPFNRYQERSSPIVFEASGLAQQNRQKDAEAEGEKPKGRSGSTDGALQPCFTGGKARVEAHPVSVATLEKQKKRGRHHAVEQMPKQR